MDRHTELRNRLREVGVYIVGSNEWERAMRHTHEAAESWLSLSSYNDVETILKIMEEEVNLFKEQLDSGMFDGYGYEEMVEENKRNQRLEC